MIRVCQHCTRSNTPAQTTFTPMWGQQFPVCAHCHHVMHTQTLQTRDLPHVKQTARLMRDEEATPLGRWAVRYFDVAGNCCGGMCFKTRKAATAVFMQG